MWWNFTLMKGHVVCGCSEAFSLVQQLNLFSLKEVWVLFSYFPLFELNISDVCPISVSTNTYKLDY